MVLSKVLATTPKPAASVLSAMALAYPISSAQVVGGFSGSRPAAVKDPCSRKAFVEKATRIPHWAVEGHGFGT
jgi:hypothetical protein